MSSSERGSGVLSATFGIMVFLSLLAFCTHLLVNLWMRASVMDIAVGAATSVALSEARSPTELRQSESDAIVAARLELGTISERVNFEFIDQGDPSQVRLHVTCENLALLPQLGSLDPAPDPIDRVIVIHRELVRGRDTP